MFKYFVIRNLEKLILVLSNLHIRLTTVTEKDNPFVFFGPASYSHRDIQNDNTVITVKRVA